MSVHISSLEGNRQKLDGGAMFGNAPRAMWEKWLKPDELGRIELACRSLLIECDGKVILCETGIGAFFEPKMAERYGVQTPERHLLLDSLNQLGFTEEQVDYVILSHLHFDHAGGLLPPYGSSKSGLLFPNAKYVVGEKAYGRSRNPHLRDRASFIPQLEELLTNSGRLIVVPEGVSQLPALFGERLSFLYSDGHTPGQMHVLLHADGGVKAFFCGDLIPGTSWLHVPITMGYDRYPELVIDEKTNIYKRAVAEGWLLFFTHDPEFSAAYCESQNQRVLAKQKFTELTRFSF